MKDCVNGEKLNSWVSSKFWILGQRLHILGSERSEYREQSTIMKCSQCHVLFSRQAAVVGTIPHCVVSFLNIDNWDNQAKRSYCWLHDHVGCIFLLSCRDRWPFFCHGYWRIQYILNSKNRLQPNLTTCKEKFSKMGYVIKELSLLTCTASSLPVFKCLFQPIIKGSWRWWYSYFKDKEIVGLDMSYVLLTFQPMMSYQLF